MPSVPRWLRLLLVAALAGATTAAAQRDAPALPHRTDLSYDGRRILTLDDPELFKYPIAFMWEPGFWALTDAEAASFRAYLLKGGFAIFEDFDGPSQWANFEGQIKRVLPE